MKKIMFLAALVFVFSFSSFAFCGQVARSVIIKDMQGIVQIKRGLDPWMAASINMALKQGDIISTKAASQATLIIDGVPEKSTVEIKENTQIKLAKVLEDRKNHAQNTLLDVALGSILIKAGTLKDSVNSKFEVKTPTSIVGVRGTVFAVKVEAAK